MNNAHPIPSSAAAPHGAASLSLELCDARRARDGLATLLRAEQFAMADFLIALADFDLRRGWQPLGYSTLFAFLHFDLKLPNPSAYWRKSAAEALHRFPELIEPLRDGRLCCSSTAELAKVLTEENKATVLPRFFGLSSREAQEVVAELQPRQAPATRTVITRVDRQPAAFPELVQPQLHSQPTLGLTIASAQMPAAASAPDPLFGVALATVAGTSPLTPSSDLAQHPNAVPLSQLRAPEVDFGGVARAPLHDEIEPLSADRRRVHVNVSKAFVTKLKTAKAGLSHAIPGATLEQVLEAALDLLLEKQARARGQVKRPRATVAIPMAIPAAPATSIPISISTATAAAVAVAAGDGAATPPPTATPIAATTPTTPIPPSTIVETASPTDPPSHRRDGPRAAIPAAVKRAVWERDGDHCTWPLDGGGCCGSTHRLELDHIIPWAEWGPSTVENLRVVCGRHNALAARQVFGERVVERYVRRRGGVSARNTG
jgi:hypothetical protein